MLIEGIKRKKVRVLLIAIVTTLFVIMIVWNFTYKHTSFTKEQLKTEQFCAVESTWKVKKYLGEGVEYPGTVPTTEEEKMDAKKIQKEIIEKYSHEVLKINKKNIASFGPPCELGYNYKDEDELFNVYRPFYDLECEPPYLCVSFTLENNDDYLDIIKGSDGVVVLVVKREYFLLEKVK
jgi:hypothetical protein